MKSVMVNQFKQLPEVDLRRNKFDTSCGYLTTCDPGLLYPVYFQEVYPGQTKELNSSFFGRINTLIVPGYYNIYMDYHLWFVPNRLTWRNWNAFLGEEDSNYGLAPGSEPPSNEYLEPIVSSGSNNSFAYDSIFDYFCARPGVNNIWQDAKFYRSYNLVWNTYYRSELLQDPVYVPFDDGPDDPSYYKLLPRGKRFDYFTSCLPSPQRGDAVTIPLGERANIKFDTTSSTFKQVPMFETRTSTWIQANLNVAQDNSISASNGQTLNARASGLYADLSTAIAPTLMNLRESIALEQFLERENRYGTRIKELIYGHFGVDSPDYRLQLPEYLGGTTVRLDVSSVPQTSASQSDVTPQGNLSAYGTVGSTGSGFLRTFLEHGVVIGLVSFRADLQYQQGIPRFMRRRQKLDYFFPEFSGLSDQEVYNYEIYAQGTSADDEVFGYQERYGELRFGYSMITGKMRSDNPQSLDVWHLGQDFGSLPVLNDEFIVEDPPTDRIVATPSQPVFTLDCFHEVFDSYVGLPLYGIPGLQRL